MAAFQPQSGMPSTSEKLRFVLDFAFKTNLSAQDCNRELAALNRRRAGCLYSDTVKVYVDDVKNEFRVAIKNRTWNTIECVGHLSTMQDNETQVEGKIGFSVFISW